MVCVVCLLASFWIAAPIDGHTKPATERLTARVPVVGCESDGQVGPIDAPKASTADLPIDAAAAEKLAVYKAKKGPAILGPRGWACFGYYGSGSEHLNLTPGGVDPKGDDNTDFMIQGWLINGDTSGRFTVADFISRVFPAHQSFVKSVITDKLASGLKFPSGPFPADHLTYRNDRIVEFETPENTKGLGTYFLTPNAYPVRGVSILTSENDVRHLAVRLPKDMNDISNIIIHQFETGQPK